MLGRIRAMSESLRPWARFKRSGRETTQHDGRSAEDERLVCGWGKPQNGEGIRYERWFSIPTPPPFFLPPRRHSRLRERSVLRPCICSYVRLEREGDTRAPSHNPVICTLDSMRTRARVRAGIATAFDGFLFDTVRFSRL